MGGDTVQSERPVITKSGSIMLTIAVSHAGLVSIVRGITDNSVLWLHAGK